MRFFKKIRGFSLIEILIVLLLLALLLDGAWSSFQSLLEKNTQRTILDSLLDALQLARQQAILQQMPVTICGTKDQKNCSATWSEGVIVSLNPPFAEGFLFAQAKMIHVLTFFKGKATGYLQWRAFPKQFPYLQFLSTGLTQQENGTFWYCLMSNHRVAWAVVISKSGRWQVHYPNKAGILRDPSGQVFNCELTNIR